jgi:hypothetical protein
MEIVDLNRPGEKKKLIWAAVLGVVALLFLYWTFFGFGGSSKPSRPVATASPTPQRPGVAQPGAQIGQNRPPDQVEDLSLSLKEIVYPGSIPSVAEPRRNIFAYYEPPPPVKAEVSTPTPTPEPPPPILLASVSPSNVYAKTGDFTLEVAGDKFSPELRVYMDGRELPTKYKGPQQLSANVTAAFIANAGVRKIELKSPDGRLYSAAMQFTVAPAPTPNYSFVGILSTVPRVDIAYLQDRANKEILNAQRGDVIGGRFRVTSISEKEVVVVDTTLKIRHTLAMTEGEKGASNPLTRPTPRVDAEDDEP